MTPFVKLTGKIALLNRNNVDTDAIIPKQFMKSIKRTGFGQFAFDEWRYLDEGQLGMDCSSRPLNPDFELNDRRYRDATILVTRSNFGCGSSREHAPWALLEYGFRVIIAESFAEIFRGNCFKNGILTITLDKQVINSIFSNSSLDSNLIATVDLEKLTVTTPNGEYGFHIESATREKLLNGWDDIQLTLSRADQIKEYEKGRRESLPWLYN
jgi:3-isopropylmalate/(R)-2-methylmalate dehydratase small subunit